MENVAVNSVNDALIETPKIDIESAVQTIHGLNDSFEAASAYVLSVLNYIRSQPNYDVRFEDDLLNASEAYAQLCFDNGQHERLLLETVQIVQELGQRDSAALARILSLCGKSLAAVTRYEEAVAYFEQANNMQLRLLATAKIDNVDHQQSLEHRGTLTTRLQEALEITDRINRIRAEIIRTISKEFRTLLTVISTSSSLLHHYQDRLSVEKQNKHYANIEAAVKHLANMLQEVLQVDDFSTISVAPSVDQISFVELVEVIKRESTHASERIVVTDHGIAQHQLRFDIGMFKQAVLTIIDNALNYSEGTVYLSLELTPDLTVTVQDTGMGITADDMPHIFDLLYRSPRSEFHRGLGLGLFIAQYLVEMMNGTIEITSAGINKGTMAVLTLPSQQVSQQTPPAQDARHHSTA